MVLIEFGDANAAAYIKFDGVDGETTDSDHKQWSDLSSFQQTIRKHNPSTATTRASSVAVFEDISLSKKIDKSSPKLAEATVTGKVFPIVEFELVSNTGTYLKYELKNVMISSYSVGGTANDVPTEHISLNFEEIKVTYTEKDSAGKSKGNVEYSWKVEEGIK